MAEEDRISSLPDHLLLEIISRIKIMEKGKLEGRLMSTKEVIKTTTTVSKRWRHLWTRLPTLVFKYDDFMIHRDRDSQYYSYVTEPHLFIDKTLAKCPTHLNLKKFKLHLICTYRPTLQNSWIHYAITRNVQEIDLSLSGMVDDKLFFNNSCVISMKLSGLEFNPPNGEIGWDKLKFLHSDGCKLDADIIEKILSGSPCLETWDLTDCFLVGRIPKSLFGKFEVLEPLLWHLETYETFSNDDDLVLDDPYFMKNWISLTTKREQKPNKVETFALCV